MALRKLTNWGHKQIALRNLASATLWHLQILYMMLRARIASEKSSISTNVFFGLSYSIVPLGHILVPGWYLLPQAHVSCPPRTSQRQSRVLLWVIMYSPSGNDGRAISITLREIVNSGGVFEAVKQLVTWHHCLSNTSQLASTESIRKLVSASLRSNYDDNCESAICIAADPIT